MAVLAGAGLYFYLGAAGPQDEVAKAFNELSAGMAGGSKAIVSGLVSKKFNDAGLNFTSATEELSVKRPGYRADLDGVVVTGPKAELTYTRKVVEDKKLVTSIITKEEWVREDDGKWRLSRFSPSDRTGVPEKMRQRKEREAALKAGLAASAAQKAAAMNVVYTPAGKRDPFESLILEGKVEEGEVSAEDAKKCDLGRKREFLEGFDLSSFKIGGIVFSNGAYALLEGGNGNGYTVRPGMHIGRRCGKITDITQEKIVVEEKFMNLRGGFETRETVLTLRPAVKVE